MKNHRFPWLRNRTTDNRKCEKARNIKEKCTIEMFSTASRLPVEHLSLVRDNHLFGDYSKCLQTPKNQGFSGFFVAQNLCELCLGLSRFDKI